MTRGVENGNCGGFKLPHQGAGGGKEVPGRDGGQVNAGVGEGRAQGAGGVEAGSGASTATAAG